jgi:O-antigen/teichoic acid export membrane protein
MTMICETTEQETGAGLLHKLKLELWRNVVETYSTRIAVTVIGLATTVIVSRTLGPSGRGLFAVATAVGALGVQFGNLGLHASNTYYVAKNRELLPALIGNTLVVSFGAGSLGALLCWMVFAHWPSWAPLQGGLLLLALAWIPFGLAYMLLQHLLIGIQQVRAYNVIELVNKILALSLVGVLIFLRKVSAEVFFGATMAALILGLVWVLWRLRELLKRTAEVSLELFLVNIRLGLKAYLIAFFGFLVLRIDLLMVKYLLGAQAAGYYSVSETMAEQLLMFGAVVGAMLFPRLSEMREEDRKLHLTKNAVVVTAGLLLPMMLAVFIAARPAILWIFGSSFLPAVSPFLWLMPGIFCLSVEIVVVQYLNSLGYPRIIAFSWLFVVVLNIGMNFWAIPAYGLNGAAIVSTLSYFLVFVLILAIVWKRNRAVVMASLEEAPQYQ